MKNAAMLLLVLATVCCGWCGAEDAKDVPQEMNGLPLVLCESFDQGADQWEPTDPAAWAIEELDGNKGYALKGESQYEPAVRSPKNISLLKEVYLSDFVLEARLQQTGREYGHRDLCVFLGHQDPTHFYYVHMATKADAHANSIFLVNGEPRVSIAKERTDGTNWGTEAHTVRIVRDTQSGTITVFFDDMGKPIMRAEDKTFTWGRIGFGSFDDVGLFDDVRVWGTKVEPPAKTEK